MDLLGMELRAFVVPIHWDLLHCAINSNFSIRVEGEQVLVET